VLAQPQPHGAVTAAVDKGLLTSLAKIVRESTTDLENYNYTRVLERTETFFWSFCDDYLELVKGRRYGDQGAELAASANGALLASLDAMLRLFAPFLPFVTDEVWSWWRPDTIHKAPWPDAGELLKVCGPAGEDAEGVAALECAAAVLGAIRKRKSEEQRPLKTPVARAIISAPEPQLRLIALVEKDLRASGLIRDIETLVADALDVRVELAAPEAKAPEPRTETPQ
jgi:valyl-tRNA synthetase